MAVADPSKKRKAIDTEEPELEIDVNAPEPRSKKALRKSKKTKTSSKTAQGTGSENATGKAVFRADSDDEPNPAFDSNKSKKAKATAPLVTDSSRDDSNDPKPTNAISKSYTPAEQAPPKRSEHSIWIGNLPFTTTEADVQNFITKNSTIKHHDITRTHLPSGPRNKFGKPQNKGFAYVDLATSSALTSALSLSEQLLLGRAVLIKDAKDFSGRPDKPADNANTGNGNGKTTTNGGRKGEEREPNRKIFVGNLPFETTSASLAAHFSACGKVVYTHLATFEDSGKCKGYGWLEFADIEAAKAAHRGFVVSEKDERVDVRPDGAKVMGKAKQRAWVNSLSGRKLKIEYAEGKDERYEKRFGKGARKGGGGGKDDESAQVEPIVEVDDNEEARERVTKRREAKKLDRSIGKNSKGGKGGYAAGTVTRMTGGIVQSEGKKVSFD